MELLPITQKYHNNNHVEKSCFSLCLCSFLEKNKIHTGQSASLRLQWEFGKADRFHFELHSGKQRAGWPGCSSDLTA